MRPRFTIRCAGIAFLFSALSLTAASDDFPLKHTPLFTYVVDYEAAWSPDGRKIAFVSIRNSTSHIFVMNADGSEVRQLTSGPGDNIHPMWSPDGTRILFNTTHFAQGNLSEEENTVEN